MRKLLSSFIALTLFVSFNAKATIDTVTVQSFQFTPSNFSICLGDTIRFVWVSGFHNVHITSPIDSISNNLTAAGNYFEYTPTAGGNYNFLCDFHPSMMTGTFNVKTATVLNLGGILNPSCNGGSNGMIDIIATGGSPFNFMWSNAATTEDISGLTAGTYTVIADNGCGADTLIQALNDPAVISINVNLVTNANTCLSSDGAIDISAAGGSGGLTYNWMPGNGATEDTSLISAGVYTVTVTDGNGCTADSAITVNATTPTVVDLGPDTVSCGGSVVLDAGNAGSTYLWSNAATTQMITATVSGTYYVNVTNNCGTTSDTVMVTIESMPVVDLGNDTAWCGSGMLDAGTNPGASFLWSTGATTQQIAVSTTDTFYVDATNTCGTVSDTVIIIVNTAPVISAGSNQTICNGGNAVLCASGGMNYLWMPGGQTTSCISVVVTTNSSYTVMGTDANGCSNTATVSVTIGGGPVLVTSSTPATCGMWDGTATVNVTGGNAPYMYSWNTTPVQSTATASGLVSGNYTVTVTDAMGCMTAATATVGSTSSPLQTIFTGGNGQDGNMFDITAINMVMIESFDGNIDDAAGGGAGGNMEIYYKTGTHVGSETNAAAWTLIGSAFVDPISTAVPTAIPIPINITIPAGQTYAFYITGNNTGDDVDYTNGTSFGNPAASDVNIQILEGVGKAYPFGTTYPTTGPPDSRIWNGVVHYCTGPVGVENVLSTYLSVYPNPSNGTFTITGLPNNAQIQIVNLFGAVVYEKTAAANEETIALNKAKGIYFYRVKNEKGETGTGKIMIE